MNIKKSALVIFVKNETMTNVGLVIFERNIIFYYNIIGSVFIISYFI